MKNYPNIGLMFPTLRNAKAEPVPPPEAHSYLLVSTDTLTREDVFEPYELWFALECSARWFDDAGNRLTLGRVAHRFLNSGDTFVSRQSFTMLMTSASAQVNARDIDHIGEWIADFTGLEIGEPEKVKLNAFTLDDLLFFPCEEPETLIYAFCPRRIGNASNPDWFCVILEAAAAPDPDALRAEFEEKFIAKVALPSRTSKDEGATVEELAVATRDARPVDLPDHPVRVEARKSIENYDTWWIAETEGYVILSDLDSATGKAFVTDLQDTMPALKAAFMKLVPPLTREPDISVIRIFRDRADYLRYVGSDQSWTGGLWMPARRELVLVHSADTEALMRTLRHESFHQYLSYAYCMIAAPPWMNEGHACLFENASVSSKGKVTLEEDARRVALLLDNMEAVLEALPDLFNANYADFYGGASDQRQLKYAMAWGIIYYLQKGAPQERNTPFKDLLPDLAQALSEIRRYPLANEQVLETLKMPSFKSNFSEFWLRRRASAIQFNPLD
ncbi:MAG: hypothetical protein FWG50_06665 [Kiritimatiellaeota bacterium]|nr:hypothetical protein [Kiritimatiellota bacterium]